MSDPVPYTEPIEHLRDQLGLARDALRVATVGRDPARADRRAALVAQLTAAGHALAARVAASDPTRLPLERLRLIFGLSPTEVAVLIMLIGLEIDVGLRELAAAFVADRTRPDPDVAFLEEVVYGDHRHRVADELGSDGVLTTMGLVHLETMAQAPFALRRARVPDRIIELVHGHDQLDRGLARMVDVVPPPPRASLVVEAAVIGELERLIAAALTRGGSGDGDPVVVVSGPDGAGRKTLVAAAAAAAGLRTMRVKVAALPRDAAALRAIGRVVVRECVLAGALLLLDGVDTPGLPPELDDLLAGAFPGPIAAVSGRLAGRPPQFARGMVLVELGTPDEPARERLWRHALADAPPSLARWAAERYAVTPGVIGQAARAALTRAAARPTELGPADVHEGLRGVLDAKLATLGVRITWRQTWADLVLPDDAALEIREFIARVKHRRRVYQEWGFARKVGKGLGLSALFSGPPGTGKTMVAGLIAGDLGLDLYQIDLSKVVSKWIGETEKNLGELFDAAEAGHAILLFDEADSLFAKRTQVQSSNDRYANLEVNYLLQRMEAFAGVVILTTNHGTAIDEAFRRRLSLRVEFPVPEADERERLWRALLPPAAHVATDIDFSRLADRFEMTGGYIKNATVRAAFLAADDGGVITMRHLERAARAEYQAMGKIISHL